MHRAAVLGATLRAVIVCACSAAAGAQSLPFHRYDVENGLPTSRVTCITQDRHGYLWIGTWEGLARFDGHDLIAYGKEHGLPSALVDAVTEDAAGVLWVATKSGGVARLCDDAVAPEALFRGYRVDDDAEANDVSCLVGDRQGRLWCGTRAGIYRSRPDTGQAIAFERVADGFVDWPRLGIARRDAGCWFGTQSGVVAIADSVLARHAYPQADLGQPIALAQGENDALLVAFDRGVQELSAPDQHGARSWRPLDVRLARDQHVRCMCRDRSGTLWIGTTTGLIEWSRAGQVDYDVRHGLSDASLRDLYCDREDDLWIATWSGGACRLGNRAIRSWTRHNGLPDGPSSRLALAADQRVFVATNSGVVRIEDGEVHAIPGASEAPMDTVNQSVWCDARGDLWVGTSAGLYRTPARAPDLAHAELLGEAAGMPSGAVFGALHEDGDGTVWVATGSGALAWRGPECASFAHLQLEMAPPREMLRAASGDLWLAPFRTLARWRRGAAAPELLPGDDVPTDPRCMYQDRAGRLWVGTRFRGLWRCDAPDADVPRFAPVELAGALASSAIWWIGADARGILYLGTGRGLDELDPDTGRVRHRGSADGLAGEIVYHGVVDAQGRVWAATSGGVSCLDPRIEEAAPLPPDVVITRVEIGGEDIPLPARGSAHVDAGDHAATANHLQVEFTAPCVRGAADLAYQYRLAGVDREFAPPVKQRALDFAHLAAGEYTLQVRAVVAGAVGAQIAELRFRILPPLWRTWWMQTLALATLAAVAFALHRSRVRRAVALESVRRQIATDIHDDLGAGLSQIAILSEVSKRDPQRGDYLDEVARLARGMRASMDDIVWAVDPRRDTLGDVVDRMRQVAFNLCEASGTAVELTAPPEDELRRIVLAPDRRRHLLLVCKEALSNTARHAKARRVEVRLALDRGRLRLSVRDDGVGFDAAAVRGGHGQQSMRARAAALGGTLEVRSAPESGTTVELDVPL